MNAKIEFWNHLSNKMKLDSDISQNELVKKLSQLVDINSNMRLLDIGCGPGKYSVYYADKLSDVVGIDFSDRMLEIARENSQSYKNIKYIQADFMDNSISKAEIGKFDIVIAPMTPAIDSIQSIQKMNSFGKYLAISKPTHRKSKIEDEIADALGIEKRDATKSFFNIFSYLWEEGLKPYVYHSFEVWENEMEKEAYKTYIIKRYSQERQICDKDIKLIDIILDKHEKNEKIVDKTEVTISIMYWINDMEG